MAIQFTPLDNPVLDPRNEEQLSQQAQLATYNSSGGILNDFSDSSPVAALIQGQAFAGAELLYYLNKLPDGFAIAFLKIAGIQRRLGIASTVTLTVTLTASLSTSAVIPAGYQVKSQSGLIFVTDAVLVIPPGYTNGNVTAVCQTLGSSGNVGAQTITQPLQPLAYVRSVTNLAPASGGLAEETLDEVKARAFAALRRRGLVSADDYNQEAQAFLGAGSVAFTRGNLDADKITYTRGCVHVFCLNADGSLLSAPQLTALENTLQARTHVSVFCYVSNVDLQDVDLYVICKQTAGTNPQTVADDINARLRQYLTPGKLPLGASIVLKELEFLIRLSSIDYVQSVSIGFTGTPRDSTNLDLPTEYSVARLTNLTVELVTGTSTTVYIGRYGL